MQINKSRLSLFLISLAIGTIIGLVYGWILRPVEYVDSIPNSFRSDYKTDYVIMVAESFCEDRDMDLARLRLASLGPEPPETYLSEAIVYAHKHSLRSHDQELLEEFLKELIKLSSTAEIEG